MLKCVVIGIGLFLTLKIFVVDVVVVVAAGVVGHMFFVFQYIHPSCYRADENRRQSYKRKLSENYKIIRFIKIYTIVLYGKK